MISEALTLNASDWTTASFNQVQHVLARAQLVYANQYASQSLINTTAESLEQAIWGLELNDTPAPVVNRTALNNDNLTGRIVVGGQSATRTADFVVGRGQLPDEVTITRSETTFTITGVRPATGEPIQGEFPVTISVGNESVTFTVNVNLTPLAGGGTTVNRTALNAAIADAESRAEAIYTSESWSAMQTALTEAISVRDNTNATQAQVNTAATALRTALDGLVSVSPYDRTALNAAITDALARVQSNYTPASWTAMQTALTAATQVRNNPASNQEQIDVAEEALREALGGLVRVAGGGGAAGIGTGSGAAWINPFTDVNESDWFFNAVRFVNVNGLMQGTSADRFSPGINLSRAMVVTILARQYGADITGGATWYSGAMEWGVSVGLTDGTNPNADITREQVATMLYRYAGIIGQSTDNSGNLMEFHDMFDISNWSMDAMRWASYNGIITGRTATTLVPGGTATRAEAATILQRFVENISVGGN